MKKVGGSSFLILLNQIVRLSLLIHFLIDWFYFLFSYETQISGYKFCTVDENNFYILYNEFFVLILIFFEFYATIIRFVTSIFRKKLGGTSSNTF